MGETDLDAGNLQASSEGSDTGTVAAEFKGERDLRHTLQDAKSLFCPAYIGYPSATQDLAKPSGFSDISVSSNVYTETARWLASRLPRPE